MENEQKIATVKRYIDALSNDDFDAIKDIYADNATIEDPVGSEPNEGIEAILAFYQRLKGMGVKLALTGAVRCAGNSAAFPFTATVGGNTLEIIDVFEFNNEGKVQSMKAFWSPENRV